MKNRNVLLLLLMFIEIFKIYVFVYTHIEIKAWNCHKNNNINYLCVKPYQSLFQMVSLFLVWSTLY